MKELKNMIDNVKDFCTDLSNLELIEMLNHNARLIAQSISMSEMLTEASIAIDKVDEFQYPALRERLLENLSDTRHYKVSEDANSIEIFNEAVAGTLDDLVRGQQSAWGPNTGKYSHQQRLLCWTYGIYKPAREGGNVNPVEGKDAFSNYPTYESIISKRLSTWQSKAPYWFFLEYGNAGGDAAYPSFSGTGFVARVRSHADRILRMAKVEALNQILDQVDDGVSEQLSNMEHKLPVYIGRITVGTSPEGLVEVEMRGAKTGSYYMLVIGGKYRGKIHNGQNLPAGLGVFNF